MPGPVTVPASRSHRTAADRGFTLVELLIVVAMIAVLAALVLPKVRVDNSKVDTAARTIGMSLMVAQREAVSRQHNVLVVFDSVGHGVRTVWDANNNGIADGGERSRPFLIPEAVVFARPGDVPALPGPEATSEDGAVTLVMQRSGSVDRARTVYLTTARSLHGGADRDVRAVQIARATGRPTWHVWTGSQWRRGR